MSWYIIPLCKAHNAAKGGIEIYNSTDFISANKNETCNKPLNQKVWKSRRIL